ncbi:MAG: polysaccharide biosynthesis tyrosine autokinase [Leptospirales bacterium]
MNTLDPKTFLSLAWLSIRRHKIVTVLTFFALLTPFMAFGLMKKPVYVSRATVLIKQSNYSTSSIGNRLMTPHSLGIQLTILKSHFLASKVIEALPKETIEDLVTNSEYKDYQGKITNLILTTIGRSPVVIKPREKAAMELRNARMEFRGAGRGGIIEVGGESTNPQVALDLVNTYLDVFKDLSSHFALEQQADLDKSLSLQILNAESLLKKSEDDLLTFQNKSRSKLGKHSVVDASSFLSQESGMLNELRMRRRELLLTETRNHPDVIAVSQEIQEIQKKIGNLRHISQSSDGRLDVNGSAWESFLESNIKMDKELLGELEEEKSAARITADSNLENLIVIDPPLLPTKPELTKGFKVMILGVFAGIGGAIGLPFLLVFFRKPVQGEENLKKLMGTQNFANIPRIPSRHIPLKNGVRTLLIDRFVDRESFWILQKEFESMYFRIRQALRVNKGSILLVTSPSPGDGKSMTTMNLGLTMASMGHRTIVVDADTIRGKIRYNIGVPNTYDARYFIHEENENPSRINWSDGNLAIVNLGGKESHFWTEFQEEVIHKWFELLRYQSDYILIDSPPMLATTDLLGLSGMVDGVLVVVRNNVTVERDLLRVEAILKDHNFEILGTVLNDSSSPHIQYSYGYTPGNPAGDVKKKKSKKKELAG